MNYHLKKRFLERFKLDYTYRIDQVLLGAAKYKTAVFSQFKTSDVEEWQYTFLLNRNETKGCPAEVTVRYLYNRRKHAVLTVMKPKQIENVEGNIDLMLKEIVVSERYGEDTLGQYNNILIYLLQYINKTQQSGYVRHLIKKVLNESKRATK